VHAVILTNYGLDEYVYNALRAGAGGRLPAEGRRAGRPLRLGVGARFRSGMRPDDDLPAGYAPRLGASSAS
jgi:hypothetical protein